MPDNSNRFAALMECVAQGDEQAAADLISRYHKAILFVIRHRLNRSRQLRTLFDSTDFLQEVWQDVFAHPEKLRDFGTFKVFLNYLAEIAHSKVAKAQRKHAAQKRDQGRVCHLGAPSVAYAASVVADVHPSPAQRAASHESCERWILSLPQRLQQVVLMLQEGCTHQEIAMELTGPDKTLI